MTNLHEYLVARLCERYIADAKAFVLDGQSDESASALMRAIENRIDVPTSRAPEFRRELMSYIGARAIMGETFTPQTNARLNGALAEIVTEFLASRCEAAALATVLDAARDDAARRRDE